jgi:hypothetical protein
MVGMVEASRGSVRLGEAGLGRAGLGRARLGNHAMHAAKQLHVWLTEAESAATVFTVSRGTA